MPGSWSSWISFSMGCARQVQLGVSWIVCCEFETRIGSERGGRPANVCGHHEKHGSVPAGSGWDANVARIVTDRLDLDYSSNSVELLNEVVGAVGIVTTCHRLSPVSYRYTSTQAHNE